MTSLPESFEGITHQQYLQKVNNLGHSTYYTVGIEHYITLPTMIADGEMGLA